MYGDDEGLYLVRLNNYLGRHVRTWDELELAWLAKIELLLPGPTWAGAAPRRTGIASIA